MTPRSALAALALAGAMGSGCGSGALHEPPTAALHRALDQRGLARALAAPVELPEEMVTWVRSLELEGAPDERLEQLLEAILSRSDVPFVYVSGTTHSIAESWRTGRANCLAFSQLFVTLARTVGLEAYFLRVRDLASFDKEGDLVVSSDHVTAAWGPAATRRVLDFSDRPVRDYHDVEPMPDLSALALWYSNVGAERIRTGELAEARRLLEIAVAIDSELSDGWVNLGVARRRSGDLPGAEAAYRRALEADPEISSAYHNLAGLLGMLGRAEEGRKLLALADRRSNRNPWSYLSLGDWALGERRIEEAERFYRRARSLDPENPEPLAALGQAALDSGRARDAKRWLRKAAALDPANERVALLRAALENEGQESSTPARG